MINLLIFAYFKLLVSRMAVSSESVMNPGLNDPVTKAVVDNIMGNLPTKKPLVRCDDCDLSFTSQTVLDTHLQGARHAKQVCKNKIMKKIKNKYINEKLKYEITHMQ